MCPFFTADRSSCNSLCFPRTQRFILCERGWAEGSAEGRDAPAVPTCCFHGVFSLPELQGLFYLTVSLDIFSFFFSLPDVSSALHGPSPKPAEENLLFYSDLFNYMWEVMNCEQETLTLNTCKLVHLQAEQLLSLSLLQLSCYRRPQSAAVCEPGSFLMTTEFL